MAEEKQSLIEYRLDQIEEKIDTIMDVMSRQQEDSVEIKSIAKKQSEIIETMKDHEQRIRKCETQPATTKSEKWDLAMKTVLTTFVIGVVTYILFKLGLSK